MLSLLLAGLFLLGVPSLTDAQTAPPPTSAVPQAAAAQPPAAPVPAEYVFPTGAGLLIYHVDPTKAADFDAVLARVKEALKKAEAVGRRQQAANWTIYKSAETPGETVTYLFLFDPAIPTADYDPLLLLAEVLPAEVQPLYTRMKAAIVRVERMGLTKIR